MDSVCGVPWMPMPSPRLSRYLPSSPAIRRFFTADRRYEQHAAEYDLLVDRQCKELSVVENSNEAVLDNESTPVAKHARTRRVEVLDAWTRGSTRDTSA